MAKSINTSNIMTFEQYAKAYGVSLKTVYNWVNSGAVKTITIGKSRFIEKGSEK